MKKQLPLSVAAVLCAFSASAFAGDEAAAEKPEMYLIYKEAVKPALIGQYEAAIKQMISEFREYQIDPETINWRTVSGPEMGYVFVMPMKSWADMDSMHANWEKAIETIGKDRWEDIMAPAEEAIEQVDVFHVVRRADLSYQPEHPRLAKDEIEYIHYRFYYVLPGMQEEIEAVAKEFVDLYRSRGIDSGWSLYQCMTGADLPLIIVAQGAKSEADYYAQRTRLQEQLGEEAKVISRRMYAAIRKSEHKDGHMRPELSFFAAPAMKPMGEAHEGHAHEGHRH